MNMYAKFAIVALLMTGLGYAFGRYMQPAEIQIKREEVVKEVEVVKRDVVTVEKIIKRPDGTVETEKRTEDKSTETVNKDTKSKEASVVVNLKPQWKAQGLVGLSKDGEVYGAGIERRIIGPVFMGAWGNTAKQVGISLSVEF